MLLFLVLGVVLLAGCVTVPAPPQPALNEKFPDICDVTQTDKSGGGYTKGQFPCKLTHVDAPAPKAQP